jgi:two-component system, NarL family, response regulator NreC
MRVVLVDDHPIMRAGIRLLLENESDIEIIGEADNGMKAVEMACSLKPEIVIMDISMPDLDGFEATRRIMQRCPDIRVLVLTMYDSEEHFFEILKAGAVGYVPKKAAPTELIAALRSVHAGGVFIYPTVAKSLVNDYLRRSDVSSDQESMGGLTDRERQVLRMIAEGKSNKDIADSLVLSVKTVERHRANIMEKLGLHNRTALVKYAIRKGLVDVQEGE